MENNNNTPQLLFSKKNYLLMTIGVLVVIVGFLLMSGGGAENPNEFNGEELFSHRRITIAPIMVLIGYVLVMVSILKKDKK